MPQYAPLLTIHFTVAALTDVAAWKSVYTRHRAPVAYGVLVPTRGQSHAGADCLWDFACCVRWEGHKVNY